MYKLFRVNWYTCTVFGGFSMSSVTSSSHRVDIRAARRELGVHVSHLALEQLKSVGTDISYVI